MRKWFSLLFVLLIIGCKRDVVSVTPTIIAVDDTLSVTEVVTVVGETAVPPPNTPLSTPTNTTPAHPTATTTPSSTPTPIERMATPTLPPVAAAAGDSADHYRLKTWSDAEAATLASLMTDYADEIKSDHFWYSGRGRTQILETGQEFIRRFPNSPYRPEVEWQMVDASAYRRNPEFDEIFAKLIEDDLNVGVITLETLNTYLQTHGLQLSVNDCQGCDPFPTTLPNLLGDGQEIHFFPIERLTNQFDGGILVAVWQNADKKFIVKPIISQWAAMEHFSGGIGNFEARHITGNSQPELVVELWGHSGTMFSRSLYMFTWNGEKFVQLAGTPINGGVFSNQGEFLEDDNPSRLQIINHHSGMETTIFEWTGNLYEVVESTWELDPANPIDPVFPVYWIQHKIEQGNYAELIAFLEEVIQISATSNSIEARHPYLMRFILGMNYVYLEYEEMARSVFESLRNETSSPELIGFSQAAGAFLEQFNGLESSYEGCSAAYNVLASTELELKYYNDSMPLCAFDLFFVEKLSQYDGIGNVIDYVEAEKIIHSQQFDLNNDGQLDWLIVMSHPTLREHAKAHVWALLTTDSGVEPVKLATLNAGNKDVKIISIETHLFPIIDSPLIAIWSNDDFSLHQLIQSEEGWESKLHVSRYRFTNYSLHMVENDLQLDLFFDAATSYTGVDRILFRWDAETEEFIEVSRHVPNGLGMAFDEALELAETYITENRDFATAVPILTTIIDEFDPDEDYARYFSLPKTLYLLGLAHEMQGNETQAVAAYWQLWHDYPTDPYALMAAAKLEEK